MNYYEVLKSKKNASQKEIKNSYKNLIKQYHPDIYRGDNSFAELKTKEINVAYDVLSNPELRKEYDLSLEPKVELDQTTDTYNDYYNGFTGTEHDYNTYANYEKKYHNYSNSSNYNTSTTQRYHDKFSENMIKKVEKLSIISKLILFSIFILAYILFFLVNFLELQKFFNNSNDSTDIPNTNIINNGNRTYDNYFNETDLQDYYYKNFNTNDTFENYEEFKQYLEIYLNNNFTDV